MRNTDKIIERLKEKLNFSKDIELTKYMKLASGTIGNWKKRDKIPYDEIFSICEKEKLNIKYIFYGINQNIEKINYKEELFKTVENLENNQIEYLYHIAKSKELENKI